MAFLTAVLGGLVGAVLTQVATVLRELWNLRDEGRFAALTLALSLESFATELSDHHVRIGMYLDPSSDVGKPPELIPPYLTFPDKISLRSLGIKAASEALEFRLAITEMQGELASIKSQSGDIAAWRKAEGYSIGLASRALKVARQLRTDFGLGDQKLLETQLMVEAYQRNVRAEFERRLSDF